MTTNIIKSELGLARSLIIKISISEGSHVYIVLAASPQGISKVHLHKTHMSVPRDDNVLGPVGIRMSGDVHALCGHSALGAEVVLSHAQGSFAGDVGREGVAAHMNRDRGCHLFLEGGRKGGRRGRGHLRREGLTS